MATFSEKRIHAPVGRSLGVAVTVFLVTRIAFFVIAYAAVVLASGKGAVPADFSRPRQFYDALTAWDGEWYVAVVTRGYGEAGINPGTGESTKPFFPLLPGLIELGDAVGLDPRIAGLCATNLGLLVALYYSHRLFYFWRGEPYATSATWLTGAGPFSVVFSMIYADGLLAAAAAAAFYSYERRRPWATGLWSAVAVLARPNGVAVAATLVILATGRVLQSEKRLGRAMRWIPVAVLPITALAVWMGLLWRWTGNPLSFLSAKSAWTEISIATLLLRRDGGPVISGGSLLHVALAMAAAAILILARREVPTRWAAAWGLYVVPALVLGLTGSGRYAWTIFPVFGAAAVATRRRRYAGLLIYGIGMVAALVTVGIFQERLVP